jgi:antitoxin FitA
VKKKSSASRARNGRNTDEEVPPNTDRAEGVRGALGTRIAARFSRIGLDREIPELRGHPVMPADPKS